MTVMIDRPAILELSVQFRDQSDELVTALIGEHDVTLQLASAGQVWISHDLLRQLLHLAERLVTARAMVEEGLTGCTTGAGCAAEDATASAVGPVPGAV